MMPLAVSFESVNGTDVVLWMVAWFVGMGLHEGGHAWAAWWLGDDTAYMMGKRTINPFRHVNWSEPFSVISSVVAPLLTTITMGFPLGMAWVPINPGNFKHPTRDHALVAAAGPGGDLVVAVVCVILYVALYPLLGGQETVALALLSKLLFYCYFAAIVYGTFNLIPIPPLDGSNILYHFCNLQMREIMDKIRPHGFFIIIILFWVLGGGVIISPVITALMELFFGLPTLVWGT